jgi:trk system potassium uptake protein TrkH
VAVVFMLLAGINFALYFVAWRSGRWRCCGAIWKRGPSTALMLCAVLLHRRLPGGSRCLPDLPAESLRHAAFNVVSVATTTGYATWTTRSGRMFAPLLMLLLCCFATCAGSTGGGIKMVRMLLLLKQSQRELVRIVHPTSVNPVVLGGAVVPDQVMQSRCIAFMMIYGATMVA